MYEETEFVVTGTWHSSQPRSYFAIQQELALPV
jgi:hypothetical protein